MMRQWLSSFAGMSKAALPVLGLGLGCLGLWYTITTYNSNNRPRLATANYGALPDDLFQWQVFDNDNEDATEIRFRFAGIDSSIQAATRLKPDSDAVWPRLLKSSGNNGWVKIHASRSKFSYLLVCIDYLSERLPRVRGRFVQDDFLFLEGWPVGVVNLSNPIVPGREADDKLRAKFSCSKL
jgi:hypothetical protein